MTTTTDYSLRPIGFVRSRIISRKDAPKQASEGAPDAWLDLDPALAEGLEDIAPGQEVILLTWLHQGRRNILKVHPRGNPRNTLRSVFATRSPRPPQPHRHPPCSRARDRRLRPPARRTPRSHRRHPRPRHQTRPDPRKRHGMLIRPPNLGLCFRFVIVGHTITVHLTNSNIAFSVFCALPQTSCPFSSCRSGQASLH